MKKELELIKKVYGEKFAKFCRSSFADILETEGVLYNILTQTFAPTKLLYQDIIECDLENSFKNFIYGKINRFYHTKNQPIEETPEELMDKAGYILYKCENHNDVMKFIHYYQPNERLCTFKDETRTNHYHVFFAVKKNVEEIKREDFPYPRRQDEYGTSVISLQFSKGEQSTLSIKNRYNHSVEQCDATFSNNLENIYPGLEDSFKKFYNIKLINGEQKFSLPNYVIAEDGKYYRYNLSIQNCYYCENNIIIDENENFAIKQYDKSRYEVFEHYILDKTNKTIETNLLGDGFIKEFQDIEKIEIVKEKDTSNRIFIVTKADKTNLKFVLNKSNQIIKYENLTQEIMHKYFLYGNKTLCELNIPNLKIIEPHCLLHNVSIKYLELNNVEEIGNDFLNGNIILENFIAPNLVQVGREVLTNCRELKELNLPKLQSVGSYFLFRDISLKNLNLPSLHTMGDFCLTDNLCLTEINLPKLTSMGRMCFHINKKIEKIYAPKLEEVADSCFHYNEKVEELDLPSLKKAGTSFFAKNKILEKFNAPELIELKQCGFRFNENLETLNLPKLEVMGAYCLKNNLKLKTLTAPKLKRMNDDCLYYNNSLEELNASSLKHIGNYCLHNNRTLKKVNISPSCKIGIGSLRRFVKNENKNIIENEL